MARRHQFLSGFLHTAAPSRNPRDNHLPSLDADRLDDDDNDNDSHVASSPCSSKSPGTGTGTGTGPRNPKVQPTQTHRANLR
jgi:hypothetical protein